MIHEELGFTNPMITISRKDGLDSHSVTVPLMVFIKLLEDKSIRGLGLNLKKKDCEFLERGRLNNPDAQEEFEVELF
jgi:hypothetical protein|tara:strand:- start:1050 stop:1280 length:231 start_codon:yes stop_codon:yes gene_type:complete